MTHTQYRGRTMRLASRRVLLVALVALLSFLSPVAHCARVQTTLTASINTLYQSLFQRAFIAYRLTHPSFPDAFIERNAGPADAAAAARAGNKDFIIATTSVPDAMKAELPNLRAYPSE